MVTLDDVFRFEMRETFQIDQTPHCFFVLECLRPQCTFTGCPSSNMELFLSKSECVFWSAHEFKDYTVDAIWLITVPQLSGQLSATPAVLLRPIGSRWGKRHELQIKAECVVFQSVRFRCCILSESCFDSPRVAFWNVPRTLCSGEHWLCTTANTLQ